MSLTFFRFSDWVQGVLKESTQSALKWPTGETLNLGVSKTLEKDFWSGSFSWETSLFFFLINNLQELTATFHCGKFWNTLHAWKQVFYTPAGREEEWGNKQGFYCRFSINSLHLAAMFHPGIFGDLSLSSREHSSQQQIFVPSVCVSPSIVIKSKKLGSNTEQPPRWWLVFGIFLLKTKQLRRHSCYYSLTTVPTRGVSWERAISCKLQNIPLCNPIPWKCVSQHHFYHLFQVILLFLNRYLGSSWMSVFSLNQTSEGLCTSRLEASHPLFYDRVRALRSSSVASNVEDANLLTRCFEKRFLMEKCCEL